MKDQKIENWCKWLLVQTKHTAYRAINPIKIKYETLNKPNTNFFYQLYVFMTD